MQLVRSLEKMGAFQALSFLFLLSVFAVTFVHVVRVAWWAFRAAPLHLSARVTLIARSTRGLARTAVWLTCAAGAAGMTSAQFVLGNSNVPVGVILIEQHLEVLEAGAMGLGLCALVFGASLAFDLVAARTGRRSIIPPVSVAREGESTSDSYWLVLLQRGHLAIGLIALLLVSWLLVDLRSAAVPVMRGDRWFATYLLDMLGQFWTRMTIVLAAVGALTWMTTLLQSAMLRRRVSG